jgi:hypothetical protein
MTGVLLGGVNGKRPRSTPGRRRQMAEKDIPGMVYDPEAKGYRTDEYLPSEKEVREWKARSPYRMIWEEHPDHPMWAEEMRRKGFLGPSASPPGLAQEKDAPPNEDQGPES